MTEYISNIAVKTDTLKPQGIIKGNLTVANGVLSGFSSSAYFEVSGGRQDNSELVVKFTTPSTAPSKNEDIVHSEFWESIELGTDGRVYAYIWGTSSGVTLIASVVYSQTYYVKSVHSGQQRTYYTSTDGETWTQVASFTNRGIDVSKQIPLRLGNGSISTQLSHFFTGTIDLNESYMSVNGSQFWKGMDYYDFQQVGGKSFDGGWIASVKNLATDVSLGAQGTHTYDLSNYLPNDGYGYEVLLECTAITGTTSGNSFTLCAVTGNTETYNMLRLVSTNTRSNSTSIAYGSGRLVIPAGTRTFKIYNEYQAGTYNLDVKMYRRINHNSGCEKVNLSGAERKIGGEQFDGQWVWKSQKLAYNVTINSKATLTYDVSSYLPDDGYAYELLFGDCQANTGATSGNNALILAITDMTVNNVRLMGKNTRTASTETTLNGCIVIPVHRERKVYIYNSANQNATNLYVILKAYRRLGTND